MHIQWLSHQAAAQKSLVEPRLASTVVCTSILRQFFCLLFIISAMGGHEMQPASESHQPHASAEERLAEQARETQQLREQLARASVKEGLTLPPLSVPELNKETSGCPTLWGCSMVCIGKNIANCSKNPQFLPVMCTLCALCTHAPNV